MKIKKFMPIIVLSAICIVVTLLLAVVNTFTAPIIKAAADKKANETLTVVLPEGTDFEEVDISTVTLPGTVTKAYRETNGKGYVFEVNTSGYAAGLVVMCGIDSEGKITGSKYTASSETYGFEKLLDGAYNGKTIEDAELVIAAGASPASKTSKGYYDAIEAALQSFIIMGGGTVDLRDENAIIQDNCNLALGTEGKTFEKWFATEEIGADALYLTDGGAVAFADGYYVGISADGSVSTEGVNAETGEIATVGDGTYATANSAYVAYTGATLTEVALPEGANKNVLKAYVTESGNYVFELQAAGYGIKGDKYVRSNEYILLKVAISADGKIISTLTTYQSESEGIGDACADAKYYESFNGSSATTYGDVENISGATVTSEGYKEAIGYAFEAFENLSGGATDEQ